MFTQIKRFFDHNAAIIISCIEACMVLLWFYGCEPQVTSLQNPLVKINRVQLDAEVTAFVAKAEAQYTTLAEQEDLRDKISNSLAIFMKEGSINTAGVLTLITSIVGLGSVLTYRKKDAIIKTLKNNANNKNTASG
jgi:hypothetical protein